MNEYYDAIIVGTGAAGLYCALNLPSRMKVLMITKQQADQSDSFLAQGGICMLHAAVGAAKAGRNAVWKKVDGGYTMKA